MTPTYEMLPPFDSAIVFFYVLGTSLIALTGMMPSLKEGGGVGAEVVKLTEVAHLLGVLGGVAMTTFCGTLLSARRCCDVRTLAIAEGTWPGVKDTNDEDAKITPTARDESSSACARTCGGPKIHCKNARVCLPPKQCCDELSAHNHLACAALGYGAMLPILLVSVGIFGFYYTSAPTLKYRENICIINDDNRSCYNGGCTWNANDRCVQARTPNTNKCILTYAHATTVHRCMQVDRTPIFDLNQGCDERVSVVCCTSTCVFIITMHDLGGVGPVCVLHRSTTGAVSTKTAHPSTRYQWRRNTLC